MSAGVAGRFATPADDPGIRALFRRTPMPGRISLSFTYEPSFFDAIEVEGRDPEVLVGERDGRIIGVGLMAHREVFLNGRPVEIGYLSSLRLAPEERSATALARGYRAFRQRHERSRRVPFYLTTIMEGNLPARRMLTSARAGLPAYHELGRYATVLIPLLPRGPVGGAPRVEVLRGPDVGPEAVLNVLAHCGRRKQFYPVYTAEDLAADHGLLRGLTLGDFYVARQDARIVGVLACWNQVPFRQNTVAGYRGPARAMMRAANALAGLTGTPPLPQRGEPVRAVKAACIAIEKDAPEVFHALLDRAGRDARATGNLFLAVGLAAADPLLRTATRHPHLTLRSRVYAVRWEPDRGPIDRLDDRCMYLELGSL